MKSVWKVDAYTKGLIPIGSSFAKDYTTAFEVIKYSVVETIDNNISNFVPNIHQANSKLYDLFDDIQAHQFTADVITGEAYDIPDLKVIFRDMCEQYSVMINLGKVKVYWTINRYYVTGDMENSVVENRNDITRACQKQKSIDSRKYPYCVTQEGSGGYNIIGYFEKSKEALECIKMDMQEKIDILLSNDNVNVNMNATIDSENISAELKIKTFNFKWSTTDLSDVWE